MVGHRAEQFGHYSASILKDKACLVKGGREGDLHMQSEKTAGGMKKGGEKARRAFLLLALGSFLFLLGSVGAVECGAVELVQGGVQGALGLLGFAVFGRLAGVIV